MPKDDKAPSLKKPEMYEELREQGASKEKAARISNAAAQKGRSKSSVARKGGESGSYEEWTVPEAQDERSTACVMSKAAPLLTASA
ncbi:DUF7218 family protein [Aeromicrobium yanjiei]|uniref:Rho termination factor n=1 Tax=Aeromicrobium yanjiei TaxID=2662028 RepID=A0A5Q2MQL8_9ACTN|nr:Rho termination factor [Aeromicrobium yanjiei]QGG42630.1 Rho termination factor [Aeromicrobium yanjiei]